MHPEVKAHYKKIASLGGKARAAKLSKKRREEISLNANKAKARKRSKAEGR